MEFLIFFALVIFFILLGSNDSHSKSNRNTKNQGLNTSDVSKWLEEKKNGTTTLKLNDWINSQTKKNWEITHQEQQKIFKELLVHGENLQHEIRHGTLRTSGYYNYFGDAAKLLGIHPEEAILLERKEKAEFIGLGLKPKHFESLNINAPTPTPKEKLEAIEELKKIDYEWCLLNNRLLDEYYFDFSKNVRRNDFDLTFHPPNSDARFPYCAGQWSATSKLWGIKLYDGHISSLGASATSKNQSLFLAVNALQTRKEKHKDLAPLPFDPWKADL
jgi:hypothetical protein